MIYSVIYDKDTLCRAVVQDIILTARFQTKYEHGNHQEAGQNASKQVGQGLVCDGSPLLRSFHVWYKQCSSSSCSVHVMFCVLG